MKLRNTAIAAALSLIPIGQPLVIGTSAVLTSALAILAVPETAQAESAVFYYNRGNAKYDLEDYYGAIADYSKAIEINPREAFIFKNRGIAKELIGDMKGACADWRKASSLGFKDAQKWVRNQC